jgi:NADH:ubiquinone oxidoreductase subunit
MDRIAAVCYKRRMNFVTRLFTSRFGEIIGTDAAGNRYFQERHPRRGAPPGTRLRRWVGYADDRDDASDVPPEWHGWLHYTCDKPQTTTSKQPWQKPHKPNATGTPASYRPPGHDYAGGERARASGDYEAWSPEG